jgi:Sec-independent protein translocase protein TatA
LGPSDLYKLVKEAGKAVQNFRNLSTEATATFENTFENQLQLQEIRKAQRELTDAFNFRRSINVDAESEAFTVNVQSERPGKKSSAFDFDDDDKDAAQPADSNRGTVVVKKDGVLLADAIPAGAAAAPPPKKKFRRRVKKKVVVEDDEDDDEALIYKKQDMTTTSTTTTTGPLEKNIPDLEVEMEEEDYSFAFEESDAERRAMKSLEDARAELARDREKLLSQTPKKQSREMDGLGAEDEDVESESKRAAREMASSGGYDLGDSEYQATAAARFQAQMNGSWNDSIVANTDKLQPLEQIMQRLALLEEEKNKADERLQEEFRKRQENEESYYREKRRLLEQAAGQVKLSSSSSSPSSQLGAKNEKSAAYVAPNPPSLKQ